MSSRTAASKTLALTLRCWGFSLPEAFYLGALDDGASI